MLPAVTYCCYQMKYLQERQGERQSWLLTGPSTEAASELDVTLLTRHQIGWSHLGLLIASFN